MIDREIALTWAKEAGFLDDFGYWIAQPEGIQALITRVMNAGRAEQADMIATLELENRMMRERNQRLEAELENKLVSLRLGPCTVYSGDEIKVQIKPITHEAGAGFQPIGSGQPKNPPPRNPSGETAEPDYWLGHGLQAYTSKPFEGASPIYLRPPAVEVNAQLLDALKWIAENGPDDAWELRERAREELAKWGS